jgi:ATP adenylyltransferase
VEILYTPWRYEYMSSVDDRKEGCIFCEKVAEERDRENFIVHRGKRCFAILNLYPYSTGHLMIAPYEHTGSTENLDADTLTEMMTLSQRAMKAIRQAFGPEGFNLGVNISRVAGAGITDHVHMHVVPRWAGDSNFMPITAQTRVLPKTPDEVWLALKDLI